MPALSHSTYRFDRFQLDPYRRRLLRDGQPVALQSKAMDLLVVLVESGGQLLSKDHLLQMVWPGLAVEESNLTVHMSALRKALGDDRGERRFIITESGRGYRFVAAVTKIAPGEDEDQKPLPMEILSPAGVKPECQSSADTHVSGATRSRRLINVAVVASVALASVVLAFAVDRFGRAQSGDLPFAEFKLTRLTSNGTASRVALTPDGKYAAYVVAEPDGKSVWVQQVGTASAIRVLPPVSGEFWGLSFSPDGAYLYYTLFAGDKADVDLFRVPSLGGLSHRIANVSAPGFSLSPDGTRIAHTNSYSAAGQTYLQVVNSDGTNRRTIAERQQPRNFEIRGQVISWSPDGDTLASVVNDYGAGVHYSSIIGVDIDDGAERSLSPRRWYDVSSVQWLKDGSGLILTASDAPSVPTQVWFLSYPSGEAQRITDDLSRYDALAIGADGRTLAAVQTNAVSSLWIGRGNQATAGFRQILSDVGGVTPFARIADGRIVYRSHADGRSNLWLMEADGSGRKQLTADAQVSERGLCASPDGKHVVFSSWRAGRPNLWRLDIAQATLTQLTDGHGEAYPSCSPDSRWVAYQSGLGIGKPTIWRVSLDGGPPEPLVETFSSKPAISNDGRRVAYFYMTDDVWRVGISAARGGKVLQHLDLPASVTERVMRWSADDELLYYVSTVGDVGNLWALPLNGTRPQRVTHFTSHLLEDFVSLRGIEEFAFARRTETRDVVLFTSISKWHLDGSRPFEMRRSRHVEGRR